MEQIPLKKYQSQLDSLIQSPILGNSSMSKSSDSQIPKPSFSRPITAAGVASALSPSHGRVRKRLYSERKNSSPPSSEKPSKMSKEDTSELKNLLLKLSTDMTTMNSDLKTEFKAQLTDSEQRLGDKFENNFNQLTSQISELRERQDDESKARIDLDNKIQQQIADVSDKVGAVEESLDEKIEAAVARHMKSKDTHINATYYQSLANEIKNHEKDLMIFGFKPDGSPDLVAEIRDKVFKDKLEIKVENFKAVQVGSDLGDKPKPIRVSLPTAEIRNSLCKLSFKLPKGITIEKCMPQRYRQQNREFRKYGWQLREAANVQTRIVFKGHKLVLEMKQPNEGEIRYDWTIAREYFPQPVSPTDRTEADRNRQGLKASKTIEQINTNKIIISNLKVTESKEATTEYFEKKFLEPQDNLKVVEINADKVVEKKLLIVTLLSKQDCEYFKETYEKKELNEQKPRISVMLGKN